jgi:hypothetical protein
MPHGPCPPAPSEARPARDENTAFVVLIGMFIFVFGVMALLMGFAQ